MHRTRMALLGVALLLGATPAVRAASPPNAASSPDDAPIWTFQVENDAVSTLSGTSDQYYTSGLRLGFTSTPAQTPHGLAGLANAISGGPGIDRVAFDIQQSLFTPRNTQITPPDPHDRPYAAYLVGNFSLLHDTDTARTVLTLTLGVLGPAAQGEETQNGFHSLIGDKSNKGWGFQLRNEPAMGLTAGRIWRVPTGGFGGVETDVLPSLQGQAGSIRTDAQAGAILRIGQGLDSDFGAPRIQPGISGADAYTATQPLVWYVFGGGDGQAVAHDATLDGGTFNTDQPHVHKKWYVGELEAGIGIIWHGVRITYTQTWQTQEFQGQKGGLFNFGSLAVSAKF
ncbi:MAG TPA: lipid A deacylase LpxR family protein [Acetobacteraceae bacterium]|nr:lipid A deacylase LpxR family protein [Acetobacteraceae bacterium]